MLEGHDTTIEVSNIMSFVLYTQILKQSVLKPASPGITLRKVDWPPPKSLFDHFHDEQVYSSSFNDAQVFDKNYEKNIDKCNGRVKNWHLTCVETLALTFIKSTYK